MNLTDYLFYDNFIILLYDDYIDRICCYCYLLSDTQKNLPNIYYSTSKTRTNDLRQDIDQT